MSEVRTPSPRRITKLLSATKGKIIYGGDSILEELYIAPTIVTDVKPDDSLMSEELFGPILPIMTVESSLQAVEFVRSRDKPLALYVFTSNQDVFSQFKQGTSSGSLLQNDCCSHMIAHELPFGGVGNSGFGRYHGKFSVDNFSHHRAVLLKTTVDTINHKALYPPYSEQKSAWCEWLLRTTDRRSCAIFNHSSGCFIMLTNDCLFHFLLSFSFIFHLTRTVCFYQLLIHISSYTNGVFLSGLSHRYILMRCMFSLICLSLDECQQESDLTNRPFTCLFGF
ncbi:hypothetical protein AHF37_04177 [Paragonimus kellicotti]|nr:hypothetical protein AHF37_04177 [Paragonimus kellicotti]